MSFKLCKFNRSGLKQSEQHHLLSDSGFVLHSCFADFLTLQQNNWIHPFIYFHFFAPDSWELRQTSLSGISRSDWCCCSFGGRSLVLHCATHWPHTHLQMPKITNKRGKQLRHRWFELLRRVSLILHQAFVTLLVFDKTTAKPGPSQHKPAVVYRTMQLHPITSFYAIIQRLTWPHYNLCCFVTDCLNLSHTLEPKPKGNTSFTPTGAYS